MIPVTQERERLMLDVHAMCCCHYPRRCDDAASAPMLPFVTWLIKHTQTALPRPRVRHRCLAFDDTLRTLTGTFSTKHGRRSHCKTSSRMNTAGLFDLSIRRLPAGFVELQHHRHFNFKDKKLSYRRETARQLHMTTWAGQLTF